MFTLGTHAIPLHSHLLFVEWSIKIYLGSGTLWENGNERQEHLNSFRLIINKTRYNDLSYIKSTLRISVTRVSFTNWIRQEDVTNTAFSDYMMTLVFYANICNTLTWGNLFTEFRFHLVAWLTSKYKVLIKAIVCQILPPLTQRTVTNRVWKTGKRSGFFYRVIHRIIEVVMWVRHYCIIRHIILHVMMNVVVIFGGRRHWLINFFFKPYGYRLAAVSIKTTTVADLS